MATRLYFVANTAAGVSPAFDSWDSTANAVRRRLSTSKAATTETVSGTCADASSSLAVQAVSPPLAAQSISGSCLINLVSRGRELDAADNVNKRYRSIRVFSGDGTTLRGALDTYSATSSTSELSTSLTGQTHTINNGADPLTCQAGDVIVVEVGYGLSSTGTTPEWEMVLGGNGTDHANSNGDTTGTVMWVEFSEDLTFAPTAVDLSVAKATQAHTAQGVTLAQTHGLAVQKATQAHQAQNVALGQVHALTVHKATQAQAVQSIALTQVHTLALGTATHAQVADEVVLTQVHALVVDSTTHGQAVTSPIVTQAHNLAVDRATQGQSADGVTLSVGGISLTVQKAVHGHTATSPTLTQLHTLTVSAAVHAQAAATVALAQLHALVVDSTTHGHTARGVVLRGPDINFPTVELASRLGGSRVGSRLGGARISARLAGHAAGRSL